MFLLDINLDDKITLACNHKNSLLLAYKHNCLLVIIYFTCV